MVPKSIWIVVFYEDEIGNKPVKEYLTSITNEKEKATLLNVITMLQQYGPAIQSTKMDKIIDGSIRELRKGRHRILYGRHGNIFVLLTAFLKRTDKTPPDEIKLANERFTRYSKSLNNNIRNPR